MDDHGPLSELLADLPDPDRSARDRVAARAATVLRPAGAFARLDAVAAWLAGWQGTAVPRVERPHVAVFAADHGVVADGVSVYPAEVTAAMVEAIRSGVATVSVLAHQVGATLDLVDVGVGRPTGNIRVADAMSRGEFDAAVTAGAAAVEGADADLLVVGEIGIGNTTAAAAVAAAVLGGEAADWVGPGTGVVGAALARKCDVVQAALERVCLDWRQPRSSAAAERPVRLRVHADEVVSGVDQRRQRRHGKGGRAHEDDSHTASVLLWESATRAEGRRGTGLRW